MKMLSKITLGTVQLGLSYGINNKVGKPSRNYALKILECAEANGITSFDTASSYGDSEIILGEFFKGKPHNFFITTKLNSLNLENVKKRELKKEVLKKIRQSLDNLHVDYIDNYLIHDFKDLLLYDKLPEVLRDVKDSDLIRKIGVSVYTPKEAEKIIDFEVFNSIQIPINIFNQSFLKSDILKKLKQKNYLVFARNVFLQGLFFIPIDGLPERFSNVQVYLKKLRDLSKEKGLNKSTIALKFVKEIREIDSILIGIETIDQLTQNIQDFNKTDSLNINYTVFKGINANAIDPRNW